MALSPPMPRPKAMALSTVTTMCLTETRTRATRAMRPMTKAASTAAAAAAECVFAAPSAADLVVIPRATFAGCATTACTTTSRSCFARTRQTPCHGSALLNLRACWWSFLAGATADTSVSATTLTPADQDMSAAHAAAHCTFAATTQSLPSTCCEWLLPSDASTLTFPFTDNRSFLAFPCPPRALLVEPCVSVYPLLLLVVFESPSCLLFDSVCVKRWYSWLVFCFWACFPFCLPCSWHCPAAVFRLLR